MLAGKTDTSLGNSLPVVPATSLVISVEGAVSRNVTLDGRAYRLSGGKVGLLSVDFTRSTGYHRLTIDGRTYWFATEDSKLGLGGIRQMLDELQTMGTGWTGQAMFSDGSGIRDPHVAYGWLDQWADIALAAVEAILDIPRTESRSKQTLRRRGGAGVLLAPTIRLLRSDPKRYLAESDHGVISAGGKRFEPLRVVARTRVTTVDTIANRRAVTVLAWVAQLAREVVESTTSWETVVRARLWENKARTMQRRPLAQALSAGLQGSEPRQPEEITEAKYRESYRIAVDLSERFGWQATADKSARLSYVEQSDAIYQAYCASRLAKALGLVQTSTVLGASQPAFSGADFDLYYDCVPPRSVLVSWRQGSARPDESRPDLLLHERSSGRVAVLDAKYRIGTDGRASEDSRKDMAAYMSLYGLDAVTILFPGTSESSWTIEGQGKRLVEVAVSPGDDEAPELTSTVLSTLQAPVY